MITDSRNSLFTAIIFYEFFNHSLNRATLYREDILILAAKDQAEAEAQIKALALAEAQPYENEAGEEISMRLLEIISIDEAVSFYANSIHYPSIFSRHFSDFDAYQQINSATKHVNYSTAKAKAKALWHSLQPQQKANASTGELFFAALIFEIQDESQGQSSKSTYCETIVSFYANSHHEAEAFAQALLATQHHSPSSHVKLLKIVDIQAISENDIIGLKTPHDIIYQRCFDDISAYRRWLVIADA